MYELHSNNIQYAQYTLHTSVDRSRPQLAVLFSLLGLLYSTFLFPAVECWCLEHVPHSIVDWTDRTTAGGRPRGP